MAFMKAAGKWGGIFVLIALLITLVKSLIAFVGFVTVAIKILIVVAFIAMILGVGYLVVKGVSNARRSRNE
jgi:uncharacterized protein YqhQ